jgi:hypothetical protein
LTKLVNRLTKSKKGCHCGVMPLLIGASMMSCLYNDPDRFAEEAEEGFVSHRHEDRKQDRR